MGNFINLANRKFGRLKVSTVYKIKNKKTYWECVCCCGVNKFVRADNLLERRILSCGCYQREIASRKKGVRTTTGTIAKFKERVSVIGGCWIWRGVKNKRGYGRFYIGRDKQIFAHRFSYLYFKGDIPRGLQIMHSCDNPSCVNPKHLSLGTNQENVDAAVARGRYRVGERHHAARLTAHDVLSIRNSGDSVSKLARQFGLSITHLRRVKNKIAWRCL